MATKRRGRDKIKTLERRMGFFTERGMQRSRRAALLPEVKRMLEGIDQIKKDFVGLNVDELHSSPSFETAWRDLLWVVGPRIWPETGHRVGAPIDQEFYPRPLVFLESEDRSILVNLFSQLVLEKCITYQRNQAAKPFRQKTAAAKREMKSEGQVCSPRSNNLTRGHQSLPPTQSPSPSGQEPGWKDASNDESDGSNDEQYDESDDVDSEGWLEASDQYDSDTSYVDHDGERRDDDHWIRTSRKPRARPPPASHKRLPPFDVPSGSSSFHVAKRPRRAEDESDAREEGSPQDDGTVPHGTERNTVDHYARQSLIVKLKIPRDRIAAPSVMASEALDLMQREYGARKRIEADISVPVARPPALVDQQATDPSTSNLKDTSTYAESLQQRIDHEVSVEAVTQKEHSTPTTTNSTIEHHQPDWEAALSSDPHHAVLNGEGADTALLQSSCTPSRPQFSQAPQKSVLPSAPVLSAPAGRPTVAVAHSNSVSQRQHGRHDEPTRASGNTDAGFGEHDQAPLTLTSFTGTAIRPEIVQALREEVAAFRKGVPQSINQQSASTSACSIEITPHLKAMEGLANVEQHASTGSIQAAPSTLAMQEEANTQKGVVSHRQASESPHVDATTLPDHALTASLEDPPSCMATRSAGDGAEHDTLSPNAAADISARQLSPHETSAEEEVAITAEVKSTAEATSRCGIIPPSGAELMAAELSQTKATTTPETTSAAATTYAADTSPAGATSSAEVVMASDLALTAETSSIAGTASEVELEDVKPGYDPAPSVSSHAKGTPSMESSAFLSPTPMDLNSHAAMSHVTTDRLILVDWKVKGDEGATVSRLTKYNPKMWQAFKGDMPASFSGKRFVGLKRTMVSMSAAEVLEHYGESIASDGIEDCLEFLADEAFGEDESVERPWRKATVMMSD